MEKMMKPISEKPHDAGSHEQQMTPAAQQVIDAADKREAPASTTEAEELAKKTVGDYLTACRITDREQIGNYLMKLCSVAGVLMANAEGSQMAADRLAGTAAFIFKTMPKKPANLHPVQ